MNEQAPSRIEEQIRRLDQRIAEVRRAVHECVQELRVDEDVPHLVAERLLQLGSIIITGIHEVIHDPRTSGEVRAFAAWAAFKAGDRELSLQVLLEEVTADSSCSLLAARTLAEAGVAEAASAVSEALRGTPNTDVHHITGFLECLSILGVRLSNTERERLLHGAPWQVTTAISQWHPI